MICGACYYYENHGEIWGIVSDLLHVQCHVSIYSRLVDLTQRLIEQTSSLNPDLLSSGEQQTATAASCVQEVLSIVKNVPTQT